MSKHDESANGREEPGQTSAAKAREAERFERQARALRENLRRRGQQRRGAERPDETPNSGEDRES